MNTNKINIVLFNHIADEKYNDIVREIKKILSNKDVIEAIQYANVSIDYLIKDVKGLLDQGFDHGDTIHIVSTASNSYLQMAGGIDAVINNHLGNVSQSVLDSTGHFIDNKKLYIPVGSGMVTTIKKSMVAIIPTMEKPGTNLVSINQDKNVFKSLLAVFHLAEIVKNHRKKNVTIYIPLYGTSVGNVTAKQFICYFIGAMDFFVKGIRIKNMTKNTIEGQNYYFVKSTNGIMLQDVKF
ncbi:macro domain containing protein [Namao virus]|nr:macro domain containing protein [Namao virus]